MRPQAWGGFLYVSVFSMWLGFFAWYRGLQLGGMLRVSQIQLLQPFLSMLLAVPLLGEPLQPVTVAGADGNAVLVASGLSAGQTVVTAGVHTLTPGQKVRWYAEPGAAAAPAAAASR